MHGQRGVELCGALVCVHVVLVLVLAEHRARFAVLAGRVWLLTTAGPLKEMRKTRNGKHVTEINQALGHRAWVRSAIAREIRALRCPLDNQVIAGLLALVCHQSGIKQNPPSKIWALPPALRAFWHSCVCQFDLLGDESACFGMDFCIQQSGTARNRISS